MASMNSVSDIKPFKNFWKVRVRIERLWKQYSISSGLTMEMVFVDDKGIRIHAGVKKDLVAQYEPVLAEGGTIIVMNFQVTHSCGSYRTTKHPYKVSFLPTTRVKRCEPFTNIVSTIHPVEFTDILAGNLNPDYLIDLIGKIRTYTPIEMVDVNGKQSSRISVELRNELDERLTVVLWGDHAVTINNAVQQNPENGIICVLKFCKLKVFRDIRSVSNAYNVSVVMVNPEIPEVFFFKSRLPTHIAALTMVDPTPLALTNGVSERDDFFENTPRKTIKEMIQCKEVGKCIVMATISAIDADMGWFYLSHKVCSKKLLIVPNEAFDDEDLENSLPEQSYLCAKCSDKDPEIVPRYKLHVAVIDGTGASKFLLFDYISVQLLRKSCLEMAGPVKVEMEDPTLIPDQISNLVGRTFLFKIGIEKENFLYKHDTYKVLKIITNDELISEFGKKPKLPPPSPEVTNDGFIHSDSVLSEAPEGSLSITFSGEPSQSSKSMDMVTSKRKVLPVMNLNDSFEQQSSTKKPCSG